MSELFDMKWLVIALLVGCGTCAPLEEFGKTISLPYPNDQHILGVGGLSYDKKTDTWTASAENIVGSPVDNNFPNASRPRIYQLSLNFEDGSMGLEHPDPIFVSPSSGIKIEDLDQAPNFDASGDNKSVWLASEANSHLAKSSLYLSKDFGAPDLSSFDPSTFFTSRLMRVDVASGKILEEAIVPDFAQWDMKYSWDSKSCVGDRPFQGIHAISIVPSTNSSYDHTMIVAIQTALYQDGSPSDEFSGSATRILYYGIDTHNLAKVNESDVSIHDTNYKTAHYLKSYRYDTSKLSMKSYQKSARHFNGLFGILAINETSLLVAECEDLMGFGTNQQRIANRIYYVELMPSDTVDHCTSLLACDIDAPTKRLIWERDYDEYQLDGMAWGPDTKDGSPTIALTFENDDKIGVHFELYVLNIDELINANVVTNSNNKDILFKRTVVAVSAAVAILFLLIIMQFLWSRWLNHVEKKRLMKTSSDINKPSMLARYAIALAMINSFFVGGLTFGFSGVLLMLRKEGAYADNCSCGSFCSKQKEKLALVSTIGFAAAIGSRLFIGLFLDFQGPKNTAVLCSITCLAGFIILAAVPSDLMSSYFTVAWVLLSIGGSGLHLTGFHFTNLFTREGKKSASAGISAAFGASSAIFPIMQIFNQYLDVKLQTMAKFYSVLVFLIGVNNFFLQPWVKIQPGVPFKPSFNIFRSTWWKRDLKKKPFLSSITLEMKKFDFYGEALFYSVSLFLLTYYLSTSSQLMYEKGDIPFTDKPNDWSDYMFARMAGWFNALGFLWFPIVSYCLIKFEWSKCYLILSIINMTVVGIVFLQSLAIQPIGFALLSLARLMLFSFHHAYLLDVFGIEFFGTLNGISSLMAATLGFVGFPLQLFALSSSYTVSFIPIAILLLLSGLFPMMLHRRRVTNWAETVAVDQRQFRYPKSVDEVISLVKSHSKIRCAGALHSCAPLIASKGIILSITELNKILDINSKNMTVTCQPGVRIHDLCDALAPHGMAVGTLGTIDWQTISGAVMTGTHGGGLTIPSLHTFISSYTLVKPDGSLVTIKRDTDPDLISAVAPSVGVLGVVVEVVMDCVPFQFLEAKLFVITFDELIESFQNIMESNKYARVVVYPSINSVTVWTANPVSCKEEAIANGAIFSDTYINFRDEHEKAWLEKYLILSKKKKFDRADKLLTKVMNSQQKRMHHYCGQYNHVLCKERNNGIPHADLEFNFDFQKHKDVLKTVKAYSQETRIPYYNFEIRTTKRDDAMLSCCYERDSMWIDFQAKASVSRKFFNEVEELLKPIGYRKHWAKGLDNGAPDYVIENFPKIDSFLRVMKDFDPQGKFRNEECDTWYNQMVFSLSKHCVLFAHDFGFGTHHSLSSSSGDDMNISLEENDNESNTNEVVLCDKEV